MTPHAWLLLGLFLLVLLALVKPLGAYIAEVMEGHPILALRLGGPIESAIYRLCGVRRDEEMGWLPYALALVLFNALGVLAVYALQRLQLWLPLNPQQMANVSPDSAFNTAVSFVTNTNWQGYAGESTMSYLTQMLVLAVQNFLSAATGIVVVIALIRGFARHTARSIGNAWVDLTRVTLYVLLPLALLFAVFLVSQGAIQNFAAYQEVATVDVTTYEQPKLDAAGQPLKDNQGNLMTEPVTTQTQTLAMGPVASQEAIKMLGTNGGGFFNANSAHPFENPTPLTNFFQMLAIFIIPGALCYTFGRMVGDTRQGWAVLAAMTVLFVVMAVGAITFEQQGNPLFAAAGVDQVASATQAGGNLEGKETRFGIADSGLFAAITTAASCGAVIAMHDSFTPLGGMVPLVMMQLGEVVFGGVGSGLYGMLVFAIMAVFIAGLMVGRTPEYLGKKIEVYEMKMTAIAILVTPLLVLGGTAVAVMTVSGQAGIFNPGAHGFSEVLYAFTSAGNNNGSAFAGLGANTPFYNVLLVGALTFVPALALGPIVEHLMLFAAK